MAVYILILLVCIAIVIVFLSQKSPSKSDADESSSDAINDDVWPFYAKSTLSQPEQVLYFRLVQALPEHIILAQVQLSRLLGVTKGNSYPTWSNRINRMSADFVVCDKASKVVAVIELDDATHQRNDRQVADAKKDKALTSAGVRIVRWQAKSMPDVTAIRSAFMVSPTA